MKIYVETPVKVEKGDLLVVDDVYEKGCHCGTRKYVIQLIKTAEESLAQELGKMQELKIFKKEPLAIYNLDSLLTSEVVHSLKMTLSNQEKIESYRENITESLRILDEIIEVIRFQDNPENTIIDQKLEEIKKILNL